ncbi:hypothetical protein JYT87_01405 [Nitrospira defluvii]|nr:hypothetical protein [Nitrospira defluvii]
MLHRLKLKVVYGGKLSSDKAGKRLKMRVILLSGIAVFFPFLIITYYLFYETRATKLLIIGLLSALSCVPVVLYAYAKGFGRPLSALWQERPEELKTLGLKIGFLYGFALYWMILGIVEFLFGYQSFRAALISFVASAAARDGFEIGYLRSLEKEKLTRIKVFPDNRPIRELFSAAPQKSLFFVSSAAFIAGLAGHFLGPLLPNPLHQSIAVGVVAGLAATVTYAWTRDTHIHLPVLIRYFLWPGFTMSVTYFLILAYLLRIIFQVTLSPASDLALLMGISAAWLTLESFFIAMIQCAKQRPTPILPNEELNKAAS